MAEVLLRRIILDELEFEPRVTSVKLAIVLFVQFDTTITNAAEVRTRERIHAAYRAVVARVCPNCPKCQIAMS